MLIEGLEKKYFLFFVYIKKCKISKEKYKKCEIEIIDDRKHFWANRRDLEIE